MRRQRTAIGLLPLALISRLTSRFHHVVSGVLRGKRGLDILQRQLHLVAIKLLGSPAELCALKLLQQVAEWIVLFGDAPTFRNGGITLAREPAHQRAQNIDLIRSWVNRHADD